MCRFVLYLGDEILLASLITQPENSLVHQSFQSRERSEPLNGDGFGVAWYVPSIGPDAALFRAITPAWSNQNLAHLAHMTRSGCVFAHVRAASTGMAVTETNTHPFVHGRYTFMHNGEIGAFSEIRRALLDSLGSTAYRMIEGTTDSEHLFGLVLDQLARTPQVSLGRALELAVGRVLQFCDAAGVQQPSYLNVAVGNGREAAVSRFTTARDGVAPSLHLHTGKLYACHDGTPRLLDPGSARHAVIVASETLTDDATWQVVPNNHLVEIAVDRTVTWRAFTPGGAVSR